MNNISICIPTYKRPLMLSKLVLSILACNLNRSLIRDIYIIIIDNDIDKTAEKIASELNDKTSAPYKFYYYQFPLKGLANVRNELIRNAFLVNADFIVFIDDDEYVTNEWLNELVKTIISTEADAVRGPVLAKIDQKVSKNISIWFKREKYADNSQIYSLTTGNLILNCASLQRYNVWFDQRFNNSGSEDCYFGLQLIKKGATIYWADKAVTYEQIPNNRATLNWLIKRKYRVASTFTYILKLEKQYFKLLKKLVISIFYLASGIIGLIILFPFKERYWGILKMSEGVGAIAGLMSIRYKEYK